MNRRTVPRLKERGVVLILTILVMVLLSTLGLAFLSTAMTESTIASNYRNQAQAFYAAEAGLEAGMARLKSLLGATPTPTDAQLSAIIALWHSQKATEWFRCCGDDDGHYYRPPNRIWAYDPLFNTNPPPGTPMGIITLRGQWSEGQGVRHDFVPGCQGRARSD